MRKEELAEQHSVGKRMVFQIKIIVLIFRRSVRNVRFPVRKFRKDDKFRKEPVIAVSESELWNPSDNKENWILTAGKIENLRIAVKRIDGVEVRAGEVFSFWKQIGNPNSGKGYVPGREIREGCVVPTMAGGLCQLSNALYDAALKAGFEIVERHRHTRIIKGSLAEQDRDATVKWNYVDLRFRHTSGFRIEAELTQNSLIVTIRSDHRNTLPLTEHKSDGHFHSLNDCFSCGNTACSKHREHHKIQPLGASTAFILDEKWPEFDQYIASKVKDEDCFILPLRSNNIVRADRYQWESGKGRETKTVSTQGVFRALKLRFFAGNDNVFRLNLELDKKIALAAAKKIPVRVTHIVVSQNLLPHLVETGVLGGRTFDVLMTRLPVREMHNRLNEAHVKFPESPTLSDFRAPEALVKQEEKGLNRAKRLVTVHTEIAALYANKAFCLDWFVPHSDNNIQKGKGVLFPASALGRKGAYEVRQLAKELNLKVIVSGSATEYEEFWGTVETERFDGDYNKIGLVIYPAYVENQPRQLLKIISKGIPLIASSACGIKAGEKVTIVEPGNYEQFRSAVEMALSAEAVIF